MKNYFLIAVATLSLAACNRSEVENANHRNDSLMASLNERDSALNEMIATFNDIEANLTAVSNKQHVISVTADKKGEMQPNTKQRINADIASINDLMDQNRKKISELTRKLKNSGVKNVQLEKTIATLNEQLVQKDKELVDLNAQLLAANAQVAQLQTSVETLTTENTEQSKSIAEKTEALHTAYFIVGKSKDLEEAKLIDRKGGLLGIGKTSQLSSNFDNSKFTRIDYTQTASIPVNSKDIKIVTSHSSESYNLDKDKDFVKNIVISDPEKFWSASRYLVVIKD